MGGKALRSISSTRMCPSTYRNLSAKLYALLLPRFAHLTIPPPRLDKLSHGDIDFIAVPHPGRPAFAPTVEISSPEWVKNGHVLSFAFEDRQVDIIEVEDLQALRFAELTNSYGGVGNILGRAAKAVGLKCGHLSFRVSVPIKSVDGGAEQELELSRDIERVCAFYGLDYGRWKSGFSAQEQVYEWLVGGEATWIWKAFILAQEAIRKPPRGDPTVHDEFLAYCQTSNHLQARRSTDIHLPPSMVTDALTFFDQHKAYAQLIARASMQNEAHAIYNGRQVMLWTGLTGGSTLGKLMSRVKELVLGDAPFTKDYFAERVLEVGQEGMKVLVLKEYQTMQLESGYP
ncbi:hypothetical protein DFS34DRAFT_101997 [Phlyctochytrium arcticum]|nr:hypothetical protein DFS34DRAFT_101997 [Phlyctochytrium arcticum]